MAKSINLTSSVRKIAEAIKLNDIVYFVYRATANKVCLAIQPDETHVHAYGRKWLTWDYVLRTSDLSDKQKTRINGLLNDFIGELRTSVKASEPAKKAPKSPKMENCYNRTDKTSVKTKTSKKNVEDCYNSPAKNQKIFASEPTGTWQCDGKIALSPKNRKWTVVLETKENFIIMSKSGITGKLGKDLKYKGNI